MTEQLVEQFLDACWADDADISNGALRVVIDDVGGAGLCQFVSEELVAFLDGHGIASTARYFDLPHPAYPDGEQYDDGHWVVVLDDTDEAVDFTARQFSEEPAESDYPVPYVWEWA